MAQDFARSPVDAWRRYIAVGGRRFGVCAAATDTEHTQRIRAYLGYHPFNDAEQGRLRNFLAGRVAAGVQPMPPWGDALAALRSWTVEIPAASSLERIVSGCAARAEQETLARIHERLPTVLLQAIDRMLEASENDRRSPLHRLKQYPPEPKPGVIIRTHWDEVLRLTASIKQGTVTASLMLRKLGSYPRQNGLAVALRELGRIEGTLFMLDWMQNVELRRRVQIGLNKGEAKNALARAVFLNRLGEIRDRSFENQRYRASGLNLVVTAIILWNTVYLERAIQALRDSGQDIDENLLPHLSPLGWEHINLTGDYIWRKHKLVAKEKFLPLRTLN